MIKKPKTVKQAIATLNRVKDIPSFFKKRGIKGWTTSPSTCPVAQYLLQETDELYVNVAPGVVYTGEGIVKLPNKIYEFISDFDAGKYPDLIV